MATSHSSEPPAEDAGGSEASDERPAADSPDQPWWSAGDEEFAGATPLFDGVKRPHPDEEPPPPPPRPESVGTPIGEALKLAGAFMQWADQSGLSDTIRDLAAEAATALDNADQSRSQDGVPPGNEKPTPIHAVPLHSAFTGEGEQPLLVCDYCPLCRGMEVMRAVQPQMSQGVAEAMASLTSALNYAVDGFVRRQRHRDQG